MHNTSRRRRLGIYRVTVVCERNGSAYTGRSTRILSYMFLPVNIYAVTHRDEHGTCIARVLDTGQEIFFLPTRL